MGNGEWLSVDATDQQLAIGAKSRAAIIAWVYYDYVAIRFGMT
jgi:hypothetical protein